MLEHCCFQGAEPPYPEVQNSLFGHPGTGAAPEGGNKMPSLMEFLSEESLAAFRTVEDKVLGYVYLYQLRVEVDDKRRVFEHTCTTVAGQACLFDRAEIGKLIQQRLQNAYPEEEATTLAVKAIRGLEKGIPFKDWRTGLLVAPNQIVCPGCLRHAS